MHRGVPKERFQIIYNIQLIISSIKNLYFSNRGVVAFIFVIIIIIIIITIKITIIVTSFNKVKYITFRY